MIHLYLPNITQPRPTPLTFPSSEELNKWKEASVKDLLLSEILRTDEEKIDNKYSEYQVKQNGLVYFEDWNGNLRLVIPESL